MTNGKNWKKRLRKKLGVKEKVQNGKPESSLWGKEWRKRMLRYWGEGRGEEDAKERTEWRKISNGETDKN